jgi:hypothetical protein
MNSPRLNTLFVGLVVLVTGLLVYPLGTASKSPAQDAEKSLDIERYPDEPLELVDLKIGDQSVKHKIAIKRRRDSEGLDEVRFHETDEWFRRVWVRLRNTSGKPITGLEAGLYFKVDGAPVLFRVGLDASTSLKRGVVEPGEEVELKVSEQRWNYTANNLKKHGADANLAAVTLVIEMVAFSDDLMWHKGHLVHRDPNNPNRWIPIDKAP